MKKIIYFLLYTIMLCSCTKGDDESVLTLSATELTFGVESGEQVVDIVTDGKYDCQYSEDWILVRQSVDKMRVIVDANSTMSAREAYLTVTCNGEPRQQIHVIQEGIQFSMDAETYTVMAQGGELMIHVTANTKYSVDSENDWLEVAVTEEGLKVVYARNYKMQSRSSVITLHIGDSDKSVMINQESCAWYESFEMVEVEGGTFYMGAQKVDANGNNYDANAYAIESPVHQVQLNDFSIGKFEVTQEQWETAMGSNPSAIIGKNMPVESVSWEDVQMFIEKLNQASGLNYRLPTEAEWEFAARGGNLSNGYLYSGYSVIGACAWYYSNCGSTTHDIGTKEANELGIFDMTGNVREWCNDWFDYYDSSFAADPQGPSYGSMKVNRGGSWTSPFVNCRNSYRHIDYPNEAAQDLGFRLVLVK